MKKAKLSSEERQSALDQYKALNLVAIDYVLMRERGRPIVDGLDIIGEYYDNQKQLVEKYHAGRKLERLKEKFKSASKRMIDHADLSFETYLKEHTSYPIDLFAEMKEQAAVVLEQGKINNEKELDTAFSAQRYYEHTGEPRISARFKELTQNYHQSNRKNEKSWKQEKVEVMEDGSLIIKGIVITGGNPKSYFSNDIPSPDGSCIIQVSQYESKKESESRTNIHLLLPNGSCSLYEAMGIHPEIKASWKDVDTILIETRKEVKAHCVSKTIQ